MSAAGSERAAFELVRGLTVPPRNPRGRREGYTTGACAAAAAGAACLVLEHNARPESFAVRSPLGFDIEIAVNSLAGGRGWARAGVVKDGGDDPDVTHGAEVTATVRRASEPGIHIQGGEGVGVITQPGLELPPGSAAINPIPRRMIRESVGAVLGADHPAPGIEVVVSIPRGGELAKKTLNSRLGIVGGLSILGTTGVVRPMSTASWRASVVQAIDVASANCMRHIVLTTGGRSERFARGLYPALPDMAFVQMGIFTGESLDRCVTCGVSRVTLGGMIGKLAKLAKGQWQTHVAAGEVDVAFLAELALESGATTELVAQVVAANTARHVEDIVKSVVFTSYFDVIVRAVLLRCVERTQGLLDVECLLFDFDGGVLARAFEPRREKLP